MVYEAFKDLGYYPNNQSFLHFVSDDYPLRFIALDTLDPETGEAKLCKKRLNWIRARLNEQPNRSTVIIMHHQPFLTRMPFTSKHAFPGAQELEAIVSKSKNIQGIFCGHLHRPIFSRWGGSIAVVAPSITMQRTLTLNNGMRKETIGEPVSIPLYLWRQGSELICHLSFIGTFGDPFPLIKAPPI
jgi:Predicted phosphohydrolases